MSAPEVNPYAPIFGELVRAGRMVVNGEEITGVVIALSEDSLRALPRIPIYKRVVVIAMPEGEEAKTK